MRQYSHKIAKSKLEKKYKLNEQQITKVYSYKSKAKQEAKAKQLAGSNKGVRKQKFYRTPLGAYVLKKQVNKFISYTKTEEFKNLGEKARNKVLEKIDKLKLWWEKSVLARTRTEQAKEDLRFKIEKLAGRIKAHQYTYTQKTTRESYEDNGTVNKTMIEYVTAHYSDDLDDLLKGEQDNKGNWIREPLSFDEAVKSLWDEAIRKGDVKELAQGAGFGYIDLDNKEVISPV